jgi:hypothetical protein
MIGYNRDRRDRISLSLVNETEDPRNDRDPGECRLRTTTQWPKTVRIPDSAAASFFTKEVACRD